MVIRSVAAAFEPPLREMVEVRNQARVHLWFEGKFGEPYAPLPDSAEALTRFVSPLFAVGVRLEADDSLTLARAVRSGGPVRPAAAAQSQAADQRVRPHSRLHLGPLA